MIADRAPAPVLVLAVGNLVLQDDGVGLVLLDALRTAHGDDPRVEFVDGGTQGLALLGLFDGRDGVLLLDAVQNGAPAGTPHAIADALQGPAPGHAAAIGGAHECNAGDLLLAARLLGGLPPRVAVVGVEPAVVRTGIGLSAHVAAAVPAATALAETLVRSWLHAEATPCTS